MSDPEKLKEAIFVLETLAVAEMGDPTLYAAEYERQVRQMAQEAPGYGYVMPYPAPYPY